MSHLAFFIAYVLSIYLICSYHFIHHHFSDFTCVPHISYDAFCFVFFRHNVEREAEFSELVIFIFSTFICNSESISIANWQLRAFLKIQ